MDKERIQDEISIRLEIERQVREQLLKIEDKNETQKKRNWAWLNSKLSLLVIGALITGVLVPMFQFTQEKINWHRQNRYDSLQQQLGSMHESLKQFIAIQGLSAELYNLGLEILDTSQFTLLQVREDNWRKQFRELQRRRIQQNAGFAATVFYFPNRSRESIREEWNNLLMSAQKLETLVGELLNEITLGSEEKVPNKLTANETNIELDEILLEVNQTYERVLVMLRQQLQEVEHESTMFQ